jgi:hypothetical protein
MSLLAGRLPPQCRGAAICKPTPPSCPSDPRRSMLCSASPPFRTCLILQRSSRRPAIRRLSETPVCLELRSFKVDHGFGYTLGYSVGLV